MIRAFQAIVANTLRQLLGRGRTIGLLLFAAVPALILLIFAINENDRATEEFFRQGMLTTLLAVVVPVIALIMGAGALAEERQSHTIPFLTLRPIPREVIVAAKMVASGIGASLIGGFGVALTTVVLGFETGEWVEVPASLVAAALTSFGFAAVFQFVGYLTDRAVPIGLIYIVIWEGAITSAIDAISTSSLWRVGMSAYAGIVAGEHWGAAAGLRAAVVADLTDILAGVQPGAWGALAKVAVIGAISIALTGYLMRDRDLVQ
jgi:ABC-2 type transport system permease protein